jgi:hypothetical protein
MKHVIRYLLDGDGSTPAFVADAGYYKSGEELVGISIDDSKRYLPATVIKLTKNELVARIKLVARKLDGSSLSDAEALAEAEAFLSARGLADYQ